MSITIRPAVAVILKDDQVHEVTCIGMHPEGVIRFVETYNKGKKPAGYRADVIELPELVIGPDGSVTVANENA